MFCSKCGKQVPDGTRFCPGCGQQIAPAPQAPQTPPPQAPAYTAPQAQQYAAPAYAAPAYAAPAYAGAPSPAPKINKKKIITIAAIAAGAIALLFILLAIFVFGKGPDSVAIAYAEASTEGDIKTALKYNYTGVDWDNLVNYSEEWVKLHSEDRLKEINKKYGTDDFGDALEQAVDEEKEQRGKMLASHLGDDYDISYEVIGEETVTKDKAKEYVKDANREIDNIIEGELFGKLSEDTKEAIKNAKLDENEEYEFKEIKVEITLTGSEIGEKPQTETVKYTLIKLGGSWKVFENPIFELEKMPQF